MRRDLVRQSRPGKSGLVVSRLGRARQSSLASARRHLAWFGRVRLSCRVSVRLAPDRFGAPCHGKAAVVCSVPAWSG